MIVKVGGYPIWLVRDEDGGDLQLRKPMSPEKMRVERADIVDLALAIERMLTKEEFQQLVRAKWVEGKGRS